MVVYPCYSEHTFDPKRLRATAGKLAVLIPRLMHRLNADTIVVTGKSGISMGFATSMLADFPLVVVRKPNESTHGATFEGPDSHKVKRYIILDDFIDSGATINRVIEQVATKNLGKNYIVECVGVIEYARDYPLHGSRRFSPALGSTFGRYGFNQ